MTELVPIEDYLFRYDRGSFWMGAYGWKTMPLPFNRFGRYVLDRVFRTRNMYAMMHHSGQSQRFIIQDLAIPMTKAESFVNFLSNDINIWPLWLCPIKGNSPAPMHKPKDYTPPPQDNMLLNIGLWGIPNTPAGKPIHYSRRNFSSFIELNRLIESKVLENNGLKWLYAHNYYEEDEFWNVYDKAKYDALRGKWRAEKLPSVCDKVRREGREWKPVNFPKAVLLSCVGGSYLLGK